MAFTITHIDDSMDRPRDTSGFSALLAELERATLEHGDVAVSHESGWTVTVLPSGRLCWENVEADDGYWHINNLTRAEVIEVMVLTATGAIEAVASLAWKAGYGNEA